MHLTHHISAKVSALTAAEREAAAAAHRVGSAGSARLLDNALTAAGDRASYVSGQEKLEWTLKCLLGFARPLGLVSS